MECLILLGRFNDAEEEAGGGLVPGIHLTYLMAEIALRKGALTDASRYV